MAYTTIDDPSAYFQVVTYTGNGSADHAITLPGATAMQPDLVWIKNRDTTDVPCLFDSLRGATKRFDPSEGSTAADVTDTDTLDSFTSTGFQVDADVKVNTDTEKYVAWCLKAGTTSGIAGSADTTPGSYTFNQTSGFSMVDYLGSLSSGGTKTVLHGLGRTPQVWFTKRHDGTGNYNFWGSVFTSYSHLLNMNDYPTQQDKSGNGTNTAPTSTVFCTNWTGGTNESGQNCIAYVFASIQGFSNFGNYEGNGNADGTFVYTGFRPALIITTSIDSTSDWLTFDSKREGYNADNDALVANGNDAETTTDYIDILSNGFKSRIATDPNVAETYFYMAFAEAPLVNSNGVPCNAR